MNESMLLCRKCGVAPAMKSRLEQGRFICCLCFNRTLAVVAAQARYQRSKKARDAQHRRNRDVDYVPQKRLWGRRFSSPKRFFETQIGLQQFKRIIKGAASR